MKNIIFIALSALLLISCAKTAHDRETIQQGLLTMHLRKAAFLEEWGKPDRTYITTGKKIAQSGWEGIDEGSFKEKQRLEVWVYEKKKTELVFNRRRTLVAWKSTEAVQDLPTSNN